MKYRLCYKAFDGQAAFDPTIDYLKCKHTFTRDFLPLQMYSNVALAATQLGHHPYNMCDESGNQVAMPETEYMRNLALGANYSQFESIDYSELLVQKGTYYFRLHGANTLVGVNNKFYFYYLEKID